MRSLAAWHIVAAHVVSAAAEGTTRGGGVEFSDAEETLHSSAEDYSARIARILGGLAAEEIVLGFRTDGGGGLPGSDLYNATKIATAMETSMGLGGGLAFLSGLEDEDLLRLVRYDPHVRSRVEATLAECYRRATEIVRERRGDIERLAEALRDRGRLTGAEVGEVLDAQRQLTFLPKAS